MKNRKGILYAMMVCVMMLFGGNAVAQSDFPDPENANNPCFSVKEMEAMMHMTSGEVYDLLDAKGYTLGYFANKNEVVYRDTVQYIVLSYTCSIFNDTTDRQSAFWLYTSDDGLSNFIVFERQPVGACSLYGPLHKSLYVFDRERSMFHGTVSYRDTLEHYDVNYYEDSTLMRVKMFNIAERDSFVSRQVAAKQAVISAGLAFANRQAADNDFSGALMTLDSMKGIYPPSNATIENVRNRIIQQKDNYHYAIMAKAANKDNNLKVAIAYSDSLLLSDPDNDSLRYIRGILVDRQNGKLPKYSEFMPANFDSVLAQLESLINAEIDAYPSRKQTRLMLDFTVHTFTDNDTRGVVNIEGDQSGKKARQLYADRANKLQANLRVATRSPMLQPVTRYGLYIETSETLKAKVQWQSSEQKVKDTCTLENIRMRPYVNEIEERYFIKYDTILNGHGDSGKEPLVKRRPHKPTRRFYTFDVVEKECNGARFVDVSLTDFKTSSVLAWVPSLVIPGIGTSSLGVTSTWVSRAIPFFLFGGLSVAGFKLADKYQGTEPEDLTQPWKNAKIDKGVAWGCAAVAGTIYIYELAESISVCTKNLSKSKQLRNDLRRKAVNLQKENIRLR